MISPRLADPFLRILALISIVTAVGCGGGDSDSSSARAKDASTPAAAGTASESAATSSVQASTSPTQTSAQAMGAVQAQTAAGRFDIVPEVIDFGAVGPGSVNRGVFKMTNRGQRPVRVLRVTPSCVCTTLSDLAGRVVAAGETISLEASLDAPKQAGEKEAKVFVQMEGMEQPAIVKLKGMVTLPVQPNPAFASALQGVEDGTIRLASVDGKAFKVVASNGNAPSFVGYDPAGGDLQSLYTLRWSVAGMSPQDIPRWWVFTTDRDDCPLVACRVRHSETGSRRDPDRFERRWIMPDDFAELGAVRVGSTVDVPIQLDHYNPRGRGVIDRPNWSRALEVRSLDPRIDVTLLSSRVVSPEQLDAVIRIAFKGPPESLLYAPVQVSTTTGVGVLEVAARVDP